MARTLEPIRATLRKYVPRRSPTAGGTTRRRPGDYPRFKDEAGIERQELGALLIQVDTAIHKLDPPDHFRQRLTDSLSNQVDETLRARRQLLETSQDTISWPLMLAMCAWLGVVFGVFGLLSPRNAVVYLSITTCAICVRLRRFPHRRLRFAARWPDARAERFHARNLGQNRRSLNSGPHIFSRCAGINRASPESTSLNGAFRRSRRDKMTDERARRPQPPQILEMHAVGRDRRGLDGCRRRAVLAPHRRGQGGGGRLFLRPDLGQPHRLREARQSGRARNPQRCGRQDPRDARASPPSSSIPETSAMPPSRRSSTTLFSSSAGRSSTFITRPASMTSSIPRRGTPISRASARARPAAAGMRSTRAACISCRSTMSST